MRQELANQRNPCPLDPGLCLPGDFDCPAIKPGDIIHLRLSNKTEVGFDGSLNVADIGCGDTFCKTIICDMKATGLYFEIVKLVGYRSDAKAKLHIDLEYNKWWQTIDVTPTIQERWLRIFPIRQKWKNDMMWFYPSNVDSYNITLSRLYAYGLHYILDAICTLINSDTCTVMSLGYIEMSITPGDKSNEFYHVDFKNTLDKMYTVNCPLELPSVALPELNFEKNTAAWKIGDMHIDIEKTVL
jgi:hypothetical protein